MVNLEIGLALLRTKLKRIFTGILPKQYLDFPGDSLRKNHYVIDTKNLPMCHEVMTDIRVKFMSSRLAISYETLTHVISFSEFSVSRPQLLCLQ